MKKEESSFVVVGVVRDCEKTVAADVRRIEAAIGRVLSLQWLLIESDSNDKTLDVLTKLQRSIKSFRFISMGALKGDRPLRTDRIAYCRNEYLREIRTNSLYSNVDWVVVADFDGLNSHLSPNAVESCWERLDWDMCAANQDGPYYDIFALRHPSWSANDCLDQLRFLNEFRATRALNLYASIYSKMVRIPQASNWIEVESAFGGVAIYKKSVLGVGEYNGLTNTGKERCEHVSFHAALRESGARLFINPKLINAKRTRHSRNLILRLLAPKRMKEMAKKVFGK